MSESETIICDETSRCRKTMCWTAIENQLKQSLQKVFDQIGYGTSERTYHNAAFAELCQTKHVFECAHVRCSIHSETAAPIVASEDHLPSGCMRSDITIEWRRANKRKRGGEGNEIQSRQHLCVIELKATATPLASAALTQLLCYMKSFRAQIGLLCNFSQRCEALDEVMKHRSIDRLRIKTDGENNLTLCKRHGDVHLEPRIETLTVAMTYE